MGAARGAIKRRPGRGQGVPEGAAHQETPAAVRRYEEV
jgi:hypothetical protein